MKQKFIIVNRIDSKLECVQISSIRNVKETETGCIIEIKYKGEAAKTITVTDNFNWVCGVIVADDVI